jgi:hypothetical protein
MALTGENVGENNGEGGTAAFLATVSNLAQISVTDTTVLLSWTPVAKGSALGYKLYSSDFSGGAQTLRATIPYGESTVQVTNLTQNSSYVFWIKTYNETSFGSDSNYLDVTTEAGATIPQLSFISATEGSNDVFANFTESIQTAAGTAASYEEDVTVDVDGGSRTVTYVGGGTGTQIQYRLSGNALVGGQTVTFGYTA